MTTRMKTVNYTFQMKGEVANNSSTSPETLTIDIPESSVSFVSVTGLFSATDNNTTTAASIINKIFSLQLGNNPQVYANNTSTITNSGENQTLVWGMDFTSVFTTYWSGTSMACNLFFTLTQSATTQPGFTNASYTLFITYEYDDTSVIQLKTVRIPLNTYPSNVSPTSVDTAPVVDTIPALSTYLPENSKTFKNIAVIVQGNEQRNGATTVPLLYTKIGTATQASRHFQGSLASDRFFRLANNVTSTYPNTAATQDFRIAASGSTPPIMNHLQCWLEVTYTFDAANTTSCMNSLMLPFFYGYHIGLSNSTTFSRTITQLNIQEPGTITASRLTPYFFLNSNSPYGTALFARMGSTTIANTDGWTNFTDNADIQCGSNAFQVNPNSNFTLSRGMNNLYFDMYTTQTSAGFAGGGVSGFWIVNYTSNVASSGIGSHNHTVYDRISWPAAVASDYDSYSSVSFGIPETDYYINNHGIEHISITVATVTVKHHTLQLNPSGGAYGNYDLIYGFFASDSETGPFWFYTNEGSKYFRRWASDISDPERIDIENSHFIRRTNYEGLAWGITNYIITYHSITYPISGNVSGSNGGTVTLNAYQVDGMEDKIGYTTRTGNGSYTINWYDNTVPVVVTAYESDTYKGASVSQVAGNTFDVSLSDSSGPTYYAYVD